MDKTRLRLPCPAPGKPGFSVRLGLQPASARHAAPAPEPTGQEAWWLTLVSFMRLTDIHEGEHHEDEPLQQHDQKVEDGPDGTRQQVPDTESDTGGVEARPGCAKQ